ncbi:hypothetical protein CPB84DRAFT_1849368 [Gymnopilus junonius]|uniref:F-box domain-containing protein n=1 Tax=Gymnopilus junonius TaxID=109634 RepID=A0A9P5NIX3_GYMJU|nr:hypothetical protein CPB84DRAFT_1849368 [Gymnopilus junonius]
MFNILQLSAEVLIEIFSSLFFTDILHCKLACRTFSEVISNSARLTYQIELQKAGMLDNPNCFMPMTDKLKMLKDRELAWATLDHKFVSTVEVPHEPSGLHDITPGAFLLGIEMQDEEFSTNGLQSLRLPSREGEEGFPQWSQFNLGMKILDFRPAIEEHDMIAFVVIVPCEEQTGWAKIMAVLRLYSNLDKAPAIALKPDIVVCYIQTDGITDPSVSIEIGGENLAIVVASDLGNLFIFNWKTGEQKHSTKDGPIIVYNLDIVFLREDILLHPCSHSNALLVYQVPQASCTDVQHQEEVVEQIYTLRLPALSSQSEYTGISVRTDPVCTSHAGFPRHVASTRPFTNDTSSSIIVFNFQVACRKDNSLTNWVAVVHKKSLLDFMKAEDRGKCNSSTSEIHSDIPWHHWSRSRTRWFKVDVYNSLFRMNSAGQRYVQLTGPEAGSEDDDDDDRHNTIHLFDFNPFHVKFMEKRGLQLLSEHHLIVLNVVGADGHGSDEENRIDSLDTEGVFDDPLEGYLPYVELIIDAGTDVDYDALFMDEERLVGIRTEEHTYKMKTEIINLLVHFILEQSLAAGSG